MDKRTENSLNEFLKDLLDYMESGALDHSLHSENMGIINRNVDTELWAELSDEVKYDLCISQCQMYEDFKMLDYALEFLLRAIACCKKEVQKQNLRKKAINICSDYCDEITDINILKKVFGLAYSIALECSPDYDVENWKKEIFEGAKINDVQVETIKDWTSLRRKDFSRAIYCFA